LANLVPQYPAQFPDAGEEEDKRGGGGGRGSFVLDEEEDAAAKAAVDEEEDAAAIAEVEQAFREGTPLNVSEGLAGYLQDYQQYLQPSFREAMIAARVI